MIKLISGKMGSRLKEDEKNEKIIRGLLKQPANRNCINCNMLGPQYVCTTFSTFICTACSGIHREFTHRVKSVSMAKFTPQEIASLQAGGNELARDIYFKEWDPQRIFPDSNNVDKLRDFIKHVYVHRRYTGEKSSDKPPQVVKEEAKENGRPDMHPSGSKSPPNDNTYQGRKSDRYEQDNKTHGDLRRSPVRSAVVNDWRREDRFSNGRKSVDHRSSAGESKSDIMSPDKRKDSDISSPPTVLPVGDLLGDDVVPLQIEPPRKSDSTKITDGPTFTQGIASSSKANAAEAKKEASLIDFDSEPEPPLMACEPQAQQSTASQSVGQSTSTPSDDNWSLVNYIQENTASQTPPGSNPQGHASLDVALIPAQTGEDKYGRKELPLDLFASTYVAGPYQAPGWQAGVNPGMGYPMQYNPTMLVPTFPQPSIPSNPFNINVEASTTSASVGPRGLGVTTTPTWISPQSSSYPSTVPPLAQSFGSPMPGTYMGQQVPGNIAPSRPQGFGALGSEAVASFASLNITAVADPNPLVGGNPFD